jgi:WD40 repeat protein
MTMVMAALLIACSGPEGQGGAPTATQQRPDSPPAVDTPASNITNDATQPTGSSPKSAGESLTGVPALDRLAAVILENDLEARRELLSFTTGGCTTAMGLGGPPKCGPGQAEGTREEYLPVMGLGGGVALLPGEVDESLDFQAEALYAVYRRADTTIQDPNYAPGEYGLFFSTGEIETNTQYVLVQTDAEGHIIRLDYLACPVDENGQIIEPDFMTCSPRQIIERNAGELLLPPPQEVDVKSSGYESTSSDAVQYHPLAGLVYSIDGELWIIDENGEQLFAFGEPSARLSSDGRYALFQPEHDPDIWLADLTTGERRNLTEASNRYNGLPQWWPGHQDLIIFGSSVDLGPGFGYPTIVRTDGSDYRVLDQERGGSLALSADGEMLAYGGFDDSGRIVRRGSEPEDFHPLDYGLDVEKVFQPAWSPDGRKLAWKVSGDPERHGWTSGVAVFDLENRSAELFHTYAAVGGGTVPHHLSWSPNGAWLAHVTFNERAEDGRRPNLWIAHPDGQGEISLGNAFESIWSPDGSQIAYCLYDDAQAAFVPTIYDTLTGEQRQILSTGTAVVDWLAPTEALFQHLQSIAQSRASGVAAAPPPSSLDSLHLSFIRSGKLFLWQDGIEISLSDDRSAQNVKISDDGQLIAFTRLREITPGNALNTVAELELWVINSDGTDERLLIAPDDLRAIAPDDQEVAVHNFDWLAGTHTLLFNTVPTVDFQEPTDDLHLVHVDNGDRVTLLPAGEGGNFLSSPDGQSVAITSKSQISLLNVEQRSVRPLLTYPRVISFDCCWYYPFPIWAADSRSLTVVIPRPDPTMDSTMTIWHLPMDGTEPIHTLEIVSDLAFWPLEGMISPDLSWIAYPKDAGSGESGLHIARIDETEGYLVSGLGGNITSIHWAPESDHVAVGMRRGVAPLYLVEAGSSLATPVSDAILENISWIDSSHFFYHTGHHARPALSIGSVGGSGETIIEFDNDPHSHTRFINYDFSQ